MPGTFRGVFAALVTPMTAGEEVDLPALGSLVEHLIAQGIHGLVPLGSTGEFYALSDEERCRVVDATIEAAAGRVPVLVGATAGSTREAMARGAYAQRAGADGLLLAAPYYSLPSGEELVAHVAAVEDALDLPIMLYNYPDRTGVDLTPELVARLAERAGIQFVKESSGDAARVTEIIRRSGDRITVFCGCDSLALESLVMGAAGWVTGAANLLPAELVRLYGLATEDGDLAEARRLDYRLLPILSYLEAGGYTQKCKAGCGLRGQPVGPPRRPLLPLDAADEERLAALLSEL
jgi:4-hydroxy-tetrahydrodipicolinate synthase